MPLYGLLVWLFCVQDLPVLPGLQIAGTVTDAQTGHPVANAQVSAISFGQPEATTTTDALGKFAFAGLVAGRPWAVIARSEGYQPERQVVAGVPVHLKISKGASLAGRVVDHQGKGIAGVWVSARIEAYRDGRPSLGGFHMRRTNAQGEYLLNPLPPGTYILLAEPALPIVVAAKAELPEPVEGSGRTYYTGASRADGALPVVLNKGEQRRGVDMELRQEPVVCVVSSVRRPPEVPASAKVNVTLAELYPDSQSRMATGPWEGPGDFQICGVPAGTYRLSSGVQVPESKATLFASSIVNISSKRSERVPPLELRRGWPVTGRVQVRNRSETKLETVAATGIVVDLIVKDRLPWVGEGATAKVEAGSGEFTIPNILGGEYWVGVRGLPEHLYVDEVRYEGREAYGNPAAIAGSGPAIEITLGSDGAVIRGKAERKPGVPAAGAVVALISTAMRIPLARPDHIRSVTAGDDGAFTFANVAPGEYRLAAYSENMPWYDAQNPKLVPAAGGRTQKVKLSPGQQMNITLAVSSILR